ncbi:MAG: hypothetical protein ACPGOV_07345 [Magnetovibrionaceae bacterium]
MTASKTAHPVRIARAEERLEAALQRLDAAAAGIMARKQEAEAPSDAEASLARENETLRQKQAALGDRLDSAIARLGRILAG